ncbi:MAG: site-2 protease family protein [Desulfovibrio sp.]|nr:site-2 protease family protein [Desulfovibrio sp.]
MFDLDTAQAIRTLSIALVPAMLGIILHEVAHGWAAARMGDPTARFMGRLTLNPLPHIDPMGLLVFALTSLSGSFVFGWAKPVPVDPRHFRDPAKGMMLVALAGPLTNFALAVLCGLALLAVLTLLPPNGWAQHSIWLFTVESLQVGIVINLGLGWLNLLPIPPLDGSKVLAYFLPGNLAWRYMQVERYGFIILLVLLFTGLLGQVLFPLVRGSARGLLSLLGLI